MQNQITLVECPRDAMQGWKTFIPTAQKISYLQKLLAVGFDVLDCGSFVSAKAIPQMADTATVLNQLDTSTTQTKLLVIVANERGAEEAVAFNQVSYLGFPFSISPTFQMRNTNSTIEQSWERVKAIQKLCVQHNKQLVVYISMGFGNPYGDDYNTEVVKFWVDKMVELGVTIISLADTVGVANDKQIADVVGPLILAYPAIELGVHLHSSPANWQAKVAAALQAGCSRFDGALKGIGGCPMANDDLVGNMDTELMISYFREKGLLKKLDEKALWEASQMAGEIFIATS